jgi:hypothetical protein
VPEWMIAWDVGSMAKLARIAQFDVLMQAEMEIMLNAVGIVIVDAAVANTWAVFANPTGKLASSIGFYVGATNEIVIEVGVPYGRRREYGFSGMTDSLGRYYANDPGKPYMQPALDDNRELVLEIMKVSVMDALGGII